MKESNMFVDTFPPMVLILVQSWQDFEIIKRVDKIRIINIIQRIGGRILAKIERKE